MSCHVMSCHVMSFHVMSWISSRKKCYTRTITNQSCSFDTPIICKLHIFIEASMTDFIRVRHSSKFLSESNLSQRSPSVKKIMSRWSLFCSPFSYNFFHLDSIVSDIFEKTRVRFRGREAGGRDGDNVQNDLTILRVVCRKTVLKMGPGLKFVLPKFGENYLLSLILRERDRGAHGKKCSWEHQSCTSC